MVKERLAHLAHGSYHLLVAPYITRALAERCRELQLPFIDTAGNAYLNVPGLTIFVTREPRPATLKVDPPHHRAYTEVGMKVIFALLCDHELADATYREIARAAQVGLGTVGPVIKDLENRGHLVQRGRRKTLVSTSAQTSPCRWCRWLPLRFSRSSHGKIEKQSTRMYSISIGLSVWSTAMAEYLWWPVPDLTRVLCPVPCSLRRVRWGGG
jgi:hypothetical protein